MKVRVPLERRLRQQAQELGHVGGVVCVVAGKARRPDAGRTAERIDHQAGVVRDGGQAGGARGVPRFRQGVLDERHGRLRRSIDAELRLGADAHREACFRE